MFGFSSSLFFFGISILHTQYFILTSRYLLYVFFTERMQVFLKRDFIFPRNPGQNGTPDKYCTGETDKLQKGQKNKRKCSLKTAHSKDENTTFTVTLYSSMTLKLGQGHKHWYKKLNVTCSKRLQEQTPSPCIQSGKFLPNSPHSVS